MFMLMTEGVLYTSFPIIVLVNVRDVPSLSIMELMPMIIGSGSGSGCGSGSGSGCGSGSGSG